MVKSSKQVSGTRAELRPILHALFAAGSAWVEDDYIVGRALDGCTVQLGHDEADAEKYLRFYPLPEQW